VVSQQDTNAPDGRDDGGVAHAFTEARANGGDVTCRTVTVRAIAAKHAATRTPAIGVLNSTTSPTKTPAIVGLNSRLQVR
jgi:putative N-acetylmannosamine-6-phosphate epimerase